MYTLTDSISVLALFDPAPEAAAAFQHERASLIFRMFNRNRDGVLDASDIDELVQYAVAAMPVLDRHPIVLLIQQATASTMRLSQSDFTKLFQLDESPLAALQAIVTIDALGLPRFGLPTHAIDITQELLEHPLLMSAGYSERHVRVIHSIYASRCAQYNQMTIDEFKSYMVEVW